MYLTDFTRHCLEKAGWNPHRCVDITQVLSVLNAKGVYISAAAREFLSRFGGLVLSYPHFRSSSLDDSCHFIVERAAGNAEPIAIAEYMRVLDCRLTVIGEAFHDHMTMLMDENGAVFAGYEDTLVRLGDSGTEALNTLCEGREAQRVSYQMMNLESPTKDIPLTEVARTRLVEAGWLVRNSRRSFEEDLHAAQHNSASSHLVLDFLQEFGGISIACPAWNDDRAKDRCVFVRDAESHLPTGHLAEYERKLGKAVFAIGRMEKTGFVFLMSEDGRIYAGMPELPDIIWWIGDSAYDAINNICIGAARRRQM